MSNVWVVDSELAREVCELLPKFSNMSIIGPSLKWDYAIALALKIREIRILPAFPPHLPNEAFCALHSSFRHALYNMESFHKFATTFLPESIGSNFQVTSELLDQMTVALDDIILTFGEPMPDRFACFETWKSWKCQRMLGEMGVQQQDGYAMIKEWYVRFKSCAGTRHEGKIVRDLDFHNMTRIACLFERVAALEERNKKLEGQVNVLEEWNKELDMRVKMLE